MTELSPADLFLVGLVLDISGAVLLARGLLLSPSELSRLNTVWGSAAGVHEDRIRNRVAAEFGVAYLVLGFLLQFLGYSLDIGGASTAAGVGRLGVAVSIAGLAAGIAWSGWARLNEARFRALVVASDRAYPAVRAEIEATDPNST